MATIPFLLYECVRGVESALGRTLECNVGLRSLAIGIVFASVLAGAQTQSPVVSDRSSVKANADSSRDALGMTSAQPGKAVPQDHVANLKAEKPRLVPDPAALEAEVGSVDVAQLGRMVNDQSAVLSGPQNPGVKSPEDSAAWKQDPAAQGGNFTPDVAPVKSAKELDDKVGREQATDAALQGTGDRGKGSGKNQKQQDHQKLK